MNTGTNSETTSKLKQLKQRKSDLALLKKFIKLINFYQLRTPIAILL